MSKETLSVDLDSALIDRVRRYSESHGTDVSGTISELISTLPAVSVPEHSVRDAAAAVNGRGSAAGADWELGLPPVTRSLLGIASGDADEEDYKEYLWRKYGP